MMDTLREDLRALLRPQGIEASAYQAIRSFVLYPGFRAVIYYRLAAWLHRRGVKILPLLVFARTTSATGADIWPQAEIGPGFVVRHTPVYVGIGVRIGRNCTLLQNVTLGEKLAPGTAERYPILGDDVVVGAGAVVLGPVRIGDGAVIGANSVVTRDVPAGAVAVGAPARLVGTRAPAAGAAAAAIASLSGRRSP